MPTADDQGRSEHQAARFSVLEEDFDDLLADWLAEHIDGDRLQVWGPADTSVNPLADMSRQLTTPGLYGVPPKALHPDPVAQALVGPEGFLDEAGLWTKLQQVQYFAVGLGDYFVRFDVLTEQRRLAVRLVPPHNVFMRADDAEPDRPVEIWELRLRWFPDRHAWIWTWDQFRLSDPELDGAPSYRVVGAATGEAQLDGEDLSAMFLGSPENPTGDFSGDRYPFRDDGEALLPWSIYRSVDTGQLWNWRHKRGAYRGTLNAALNWTFAQHAARDASGSTVFAVGVEPPAAGTRAAVNRNGGRSAMSGTGTIATVQLTPGSVFYHNRQDGDGQAFFHESGPGANLDSVSGYATLYEQKQAVRWGLNPSDVIRGNASPMSGAALFVSTRGRREFSAQVQPLFRRADLESIRIAAALLNTAGIGAFPTAGYTLAYHEIPESPGEEKAKRDALQWDLDHGAITPIGLVQARRPGISEADARTLLVESEVQKRELVAEVAAELERRNLVAATPDSATDIELAPTDLASIVTVDEVRAQEGLAPIAGGDSTVAAFKAASTTAATIAGEQAADDSPDQD